MYSWQISTPGVPRFRVNQRHCKDKDTELPAHFANPTESDLLVCSESHTTPGRRSKPMERLERLQTNELRVERLSEDAQLLIAELLVLTVAF